MAIPLSQHNLYEKFLQNLYDNKLNMISLNTVILILLIISMVIIYLMWMIYNPQCPPRIIEYKYRPQTLKEQLQNPDKPSDIFSNMFDTSKQEIFY